MTSIGELAEKTVGPYELRELLGRGRLTAVYRAYQHEKRREVMVKVMDEDLTGATGYLERFNAGARAAASLDHPHIVPFYDYGTQVELSYTVARYLTGGTLEERIHQADVQNRPRASLSEIGELLTQIASALDYAHLKGIFHDGIRPKNILFDNRGSAYVADFGTARLLRQMSPVLEGAVYLSPERWRMTETAAPVDQYALAVIAYQLVAGRLPFEANSDRQLMYENLNELPPSLVGIRPELPEAVSLVLGRALSKDPAARFRSVTQFAQAFNSAIEGVSGEPSGFFVFKLPKRVRPPSAAAAIKIVQREAAGKPAGTGPSGAQLEIAPTAQKTKLAKRPAAAAPADQAAPPVQNVSSAPITKKWPPAVPVISPIPALPAKPAPHGPRREYILGLIAVSLVMLMLSAVLIVREDRRPVRDANALVQSDLGAAKRQPGLVILPTDLPTASAAVEIDAIGIEAVQIGVNTVQFAASRTDQISGIRWDFGDGAVTDDAAPAHSYAAAGRYTVRLTAVDANDSEIAIEAPIEVAAGCVLTPKGDAARLYAAPVTIHVITTPGLIAKDHELFTMQSQRGGDGFIWYRITFDGTAGWVHSSAVRIVAGICP